MIFGYTRYSVFTPGAKVWRGMRELGEEAYKEFLFSDDRLSLREHIFKNFSLPLLINNLEANNNYYHIIEYSDELPEVRKQSLLDSCDRHDRIIPVLAGKRNKKINEILNMAYSNGEFYSGDALGLFRLDDDDLLASNYVSNAKKYISGQYIGHVVSFPKGLTGWYDYKEKSYSVVKKVYHPKINIGLMTVNSVELCRDGGVRANLFSTGAHTSCDERFPVILDASFNAFFWTRSGIQDTAVNKDEFKKRTVRELDRLADGCQSDLLGLDGIADFLSI